MIKVAVWDGKKHDFEIKDIKNDLHTYYRIIDCSTIDITQYRDLDIIVDDEGLLIESPRQTASYRSKDNSVEYGALFGTLIFCNHDDDGNTTSLTYNDIMMLNALPRGFYFDEYNETHYIICLIE